MPKYHVFSLITFISFIPVILLSGCTALTDGPSPPQPLRLLASTNIIADVLKNIAGDEVQVDSLLPLGVDPHAFEPAPQDLAKISAADLIFLNGAGLEATLKRYFKDADNSGRLVDLSQGIELISHREIDSEEEIHGEYDPHVWFDPTNVIIWVENIQSALMSVDPANAPGYQQNAEAYTQELLELDAWIQEQVALLPEEQRLLVTDHLIFSYFARRYGFQQVGAVVPAFSSLAEPSAQEMAALESEIKALGVKAIFVGYTFNPALAERLAKDTGIQVITIYTGSLSEAGGPADTYLKYMRYNVSAIVTALK